VAEWVEKSIGREVTFDEDTGDEAQLREAFDQLSTEARAQLAASGFLFKNVTIKVRFEGFETHTRSRTLKHYTDDLHAIKDTAWEMFKPFLGRRRIRLVGVRLSSLFTGRGQKKLA
jgi:nucleotidyltransferase/DNA polymerase involved in DNA repair